MASLALSIAACSGTAEPPNASARHLGATPSFLSDSLLQVVVEMDAGASDEAIRDYADCAAAEAMALQGVNYARHVRTLTSEEAGIRSADAVYTVSNVQPEEGVYLIREETLLACAEQGIPGV